MAGGRISTTAAGQGRGFRVDIRVEGVERTSEEFKQARRQFNQRIRSVMQDVGQRKVLPEMRSDMRSRIGNRWADSLFVQRERSGVFIGSRMRGNLNRAMGWLDFGGKRPMDHGRRTGPKIIVRTLDAKRPVIDDAVLEGLLKAFDPLEHS